MVSLPAEPAPSLVEVGDRRFVVSLGEPGTSLVAETSSGERVRLLPWSLNDHLDALERHTRPGVGDALQFDHEGFAREVLARSGVATPCADELLPLALWWAVRGGARLSCDSTSPTCTSHQGWLELDGARARLRPWTFGERQRALSECHQAQSNGSRSFRFGRYLRAMLRSSIVEVQPPPFERLEGAAAVALLNAVVTLNTCRDGAEDRLVNGERGNAFAATTLRLCRALGWTPSQVWAMPALESERLLALLDATEPVAAPTESNGPRGSTLRHHPDAVVIDFEEA